MGGTEPGAELREEDVGADCQQQGLLFNKTITASVKITAHILHINVKTVQGYVCVLVRHSFPCPGTISGQLTLRVPNPLSGFFSSLLFVLSLFCLMQIFYFAMF